MMTFDQSISQRYLHCSPTSSSTMHQRCATWVEGRSTLRTAGLKPQPDAHYQGITRAAAGWRRWV